MEQHSTFDYAGVCKRATEAQGLQAFADADGWTVEQTGGFTMVAVRYLADGTVWTVTRDGQPDAPYFAVRSTVKAWEQTLDAEPLDVRYLRLTVALHLGASS